MNRSLWISSLILAVVAGSGVQAQDCGPLWKQKCFPNLPRYFRPMEQPPCEPSMPPSTTDPTAPPSSTMPFQDAFASAGQGGTQAAASYAPGMFGDLLGGCVGTLVDVTGFPAGTLACMPSPEQAAAFKIAESESPVPQNRVYYNFNYLGNINVDVTGAGLPPVQLFRHLVAFEKTLFGGDASIGLRLPILKLGGNPAYEATAIGDMSILMKYAVINNRDTGNVLSGGLVMRVPTGGYFAFMNPNGLRTRIQVRFNDLYFQPWGGYLYNLTPALFVHGFHSLSVPTLGIDVLYMSNDVGVGYWLYRNPEGALQGIVPTFEVHVNTPFRNRTPPPGPGGPGGVLMSDQISLTTGAYFMFARGTLGGAVGVPVAGLHTIEALASYTMRW